LGIDYHINDSKAIKVPGWQKSENKVGNPNLKKEFIGLIMKEEGIKIGDKYLICLDVDAKTQYGNTLDEQTELFNNVSSIIGIDSWYPAVERTINGGYHIFMLIEEKDFLIIGKNYGISVETFINESLSSSISPPSA
jgi:hypothetical protein